MTDIEMFAKGLFEWGKYWKSAMGLPSDDSANSTAGAKGKELRYPN